MSWSTRRRETQHQDEVLRALLDKMDRRATDVAEAEALLGPGGIDAWMDRALRGACRSGWFVAPLALTQAEAQTLTRYCRVLYEDDTMTVDDDCTLFGVPVHGSESAHAERE